MNKIRLITVCLAVLVAGACSAAATFFRFDSGETFTADKSYFSERRHTTTAPVSADMADIRAMVTLTQHARICCIGFAEGRHEAGSRTPRRGRGTASDPGVRRGANV
jgi:hypothetical protein